MLYEILMQDENYKELTNAFKNFGINNFKIIKKDKKLSVSEQDLLILKQYFENIIIK